MAAGLADGSIARPAAGSLSELAASSAARAAGLGDAVGAEAYGRMAAHGAGSLHLDTSHMPAPPPTPATAGRKRLEHPIPVGPEMFPLRERRRTRTEAKSVSNWTTINRWI